MFVIYIDYFAVFAKHKTERNMFVKSFVVGAVGAFVLIKMELRAGSHATDYPAPRRQGY